MYHALSRRRLSRRSRTGAALVMATATVAATLSAARCPAMDLAEWEASPPATPYLPADMPIGGMEVLVHPSDGDLQLVFHQTAMYSYQLGARSGPGTGTWSGTANGDPVSFFNIANLRRITAPDPYGMTLGFSSVKTTIMMQAVPLGSPVGSEYLANGVYDLGPIVPAGLSADTDVSTLTNVWTSYLHNDSTGHSTEFRAPVYAVPDSHTSTTPIPAGPNQVATLSGRLPYAGGASVTFSTVTAGSFTSVDGTESLTDLESRTTQLHFPVPSDNGSTQTWELSLDGQFGGLATVTFQYDPLELPANFDPHNLRIEHFANGQWVTLDGTVDVANHTITVQTPSFSPFALGVVPEPATAGVLIGAAGVLVMRRRKTS